MIEVDKYIIYQKVMKTRGAWLAQSVEYVTPSQGREFKPHVGHKKVMKLKQDMDQE